MITVVWSVAIFTDNLINHTMFRKNSTNRTCRLLLLIAAFPFVLSCAREELGVDTLTRDTDKISLDYGDGSAATFTVRTNGRWTVTTDANWLTLSPEEGTGDGHTYQTITATASGNTGLSRSATIILSDSQNTLEITATQASGIFEIGSPALGGSLRLNASAAAAVEVPYTKAQGNEEITIEGVLSGTAAAGLSFEKFTGTAAPGNGTVSAPISGIPSAMGNFTLTVTVYYKGQIENETEISGMVLDENTILYLPGSNFPWGGHYVENTGGVRSHLGENLGVTVDDELVECGATNPGTTDLFRAGMEEFMAARGLKGYAGSKVYEHGEMLKIGTGSAVGYFETPALSTLSEDGDLILEFDFARWAGDTGDITVTALDGGEIDGSALSMAERELIHYAIIVRGATPSTRIRWEGHVAGKTRFFVSNIEISVFSELKEPLATPENLTAKPYETSIDFTWNPVPFASAYDISLAMSSTPDYTKVMRVKEAAATLDGLVMDTDYTASVRAVYEENEAMNSQWSESCSTKTLWKLPELAAPTISIYKSERALAIVEFKGDTEHESGRTFSLELRDESGNVLRSYPNGNYGQAGGIYYNRFTLANLKTSTKYKIAVRQHSSDLGAYADSEWAVYDYTSEPDVDYSQYVFYEDFNNMWIGGDLANLSWGPNTSYSTNYPIGNFVSEEASMAECTTICYPPGSSANAWNNGSLAYLNTYWTKWNYGQEITDAVVASEKTIQYMLYPAAGCIKYGSGTLNGFIVLPELRSLTGPTDVTVSFDVVPYVLPNATDGELVGISDGAKCSVALHSGSGGSIEGATGGVLAFSNKSAKEKGAWVPETHTFTIKGATSTTRIVIASGDAGETKGGVNRMWLDKVTVKKK